MRQEPHPRLMQQTQEGVITHVAAIIDIGDPDPQFGAEGKMLRQIQFDSRHALPRHPAKIHFANERVVATVWFIRFAVAARIVYDYRVKEARQVASGHCWRGGLLLLIRQHRADHPTIMARAVEFTEEDVLPAG